MARKVFVSSDMSVDERLIEVAESSPEAALIWPWLITTFDDWGRAEASPRRLKATAFPMIPTITPAVIEQAIQLYAEAGLIQHYEVGGKWYMAIQADKWFKYQTHIRTEKREKDESRYPAAPDAYKEESAQVRETARDDAQPREDANPRARFSPSPSPSLSPSPTEEETEPADAAPPAAPADVPELDAIEPTIAELEVARKIQQVRGMASIPELDIISHLREVLTIRGSPLSERAMIADATRFRDHWNVKRTNHPAEKKWAGWKNAMTNWFERTEDRTNDDRQRATGNTDRRAATNSGVPAEGLYADPRVRAPTVTGIRRRIGAG